MNPIDQPDIFETITLAGVTWSGTVTITGLAIEMAWDVQDAAGKNGATATRKGKKLATPVIRFDLVVDPGHAIDQFSEWYETWVPLLESCFAGDDAIGLTIEHPDFQALRCDSLLVKKIGQVERDPEDYGHGFADVAFTQYAPAKSASTKGASGSKGKDSDGGTGYDPNDPNDPINRRRIELENLVDQL